MGLGGKALIKALLRTDARFANTCMSYAAYCKVGHGGTIPKQACVNGKGEPDEEEEDAVVPIESGQEERGYGVGVVELMLRKYALIKGCVRLADLAKRWRELAEREIRRFPDAHTFVFLFDDEVNIPLAKGDTQRKRISDPLTAEELVLLGPHRFLCTRDVEGFDKKIALMFSSAAEQRKKAGRMVVTPFEVFMQKHMQTRGMREDEIEFATRAIAAADFAALGPRRRIIVDRGVWRPSFERRLGDGGGAQTMGVIRKSFPEHGEFRDCTLHVRAMAEMETSLVRTPAVGIGVSRLENLSSAANSVLIQAIHVARARIETVADTGLRDRLKAALNALASSPDVKLVAAAATLDKAAHNPSNGIFRETLPREPNKDYIRRTLSRVRELLNAVVLLVNEANVAAGEPDPDPDAAERAWILVDQWGVRRLDAMQGCHIVGEADLKIARYARLFAGEHVFVECSDTDCLPILLLAVKDWVPVDGGPFRGKLTLDLTIPSDLKAKNPKPPMAQTLNPGRAFYWNVGAKAIPQKGMVDILALWTEIYEWFGREFSVVRNPVEVFCLLVILMGTDYVHNPPALGPASLWKAFVSCGLYKHLALAVARDRHMGAAMAADPSIFDAESVDRDAGTARMVAVLTRNVSARSRKLAVNETAVWKFLFEAYQAMIKNERRRPDTAQLQAMVRRACWQLAYWYAGDSREGRECEDEMASITVGGAPVSLHGWEWIPDGSEPDKDKVETVRPVISGSLGRFRRGGHLSAQASRVVAVREFRQWQRVRVGLSTSSSSSSSSSSS